MAKEDSNSQKSVVNVPSLSVCLRFYLYTMSWCLGLHNALMNEKFSAFSECLTWNRAITCIYLCVSVFSEKRSAGYSSIKWRTFTSSHDKEATCMDQDIFAHSIRCNEDLKLLWIVVAILTELLNDVGLFGTPNFQVTDSRCLVYHSFLEPCIFTCFGLFAPTSSCFFVWAAA